MWDCCRRQDLYNSLSMTTGSDGYLYNSMKTGSWNSMYVTTDRATTGFPVQAVNPVRELFCFCILAKLRSTRDVLPRLCLTHHCARLCRTQHPTRSCFSGFGPGDSEGCLSCWLHTVAWRKVNDIRPHLGDDC